MVLTRAAVLLLLAAAAAGADLDALRRFYLDDIHVLREYRPGKNSFVEGPNRRLGSYAAPGQRLTLLDVAGTGCLTHVWSTWKESNGNHRLEFFLDGATQPQIAATPDELIAAASRMDDPPTPVTGFIGKNQARNLFLPVPFTNGLRLDLVTVEPTYLIFYQIDYRLGAGSRAERRITAQVENGQLTLRATPPVRPMPSPAPTTSALNQVILPAGGLCEALAVDGPALVRSWSIRPLVASNGLAELDLVIRYDGESGAAVRAPLADFFGPFTGASLCTDPNSGSRTCYLPMPVRQRAVLTLHNRSPKAVEVACAAVVEPRGEWLPSWGYFHALGRQTVPTTGCRQHEVLTVRGRGQWLGMALYNTGHDHGGGDFAVIDAAGDQPAFLHGINGEDYFTFAWFGRGQHHPFAIAGSNESGRYRHHLDNPYPFQRDLRVYWGAYPDLALRSVAYWYQAEPGDTVVRDDAESADWDCFGPVPLPLDGQYRPPSDPFTVLPAVADLDAGRQFECRCVGEHFTSGWMKQRSFGPMLDLTYLARHGTRIKGEIELGGMGHAFLARRTVVAAAARTATLQLSHDDPIRVLVNGREVYRGGAHSGFETVRFPAALRAGKNEVVVQLTSFFNVNFNWAGFALREEGPPP